MEKKFEMQSDLERHECVSWHEGQNIIFRCTTCSFLRQINLVSGKLSILQKGDPNALHSGSHQAVVQTPSLANGN